MTGRGWAYVGAITGGTLSVAANVGHAIEGHSGGRYAPGAIIAAAVWPILLLISLEILGRVPWPQGWRWTLIRWAGVTPVAAVAAIVSYRHASGLLAIYDPGDGVSATIGPLAVDGLMVISTAALLATSGVTAVAPVATVASSDDTATDPATAVTTGRTVLPPLPESPRAQVEWLAQALSQGRDDWRQVTSGWSAKTTERRLKAAREALTADERIMQ